MTSTNFITKAFHNENNEFLIDLWHKCKLVAPWNNPAHDFKRKLDFQEEGLMSSCEDLLVASVMASYEGHQGWINYLAIDPASKKHEFGRQMMNLVMKYLDRLNWPKINGQVQTTNTGVIEFDHKLGFKTKEVFNMGKRLIPDDVRSYLL